MTQFLRVTARRFWSLCALLVITFAVIVQLGRQLSPQLNHYREYLGEYLSEQLSAQVTINELEATWSGFVPTLRVSGIRLYPSEADAISQSAPSTQEASQRALSALSSSGLVVSEVASSVSLDDASTTASSKAAPLEPQSSPAHTWLEDLGLLLSEGQLSEGQLPESQRTRKRDLSSVYSFFSSPSPSLYIGQATVSLDLLQSVLQRRLVWGDIELSDSNIRLQRTHSGKWAIAGLKTDRSYTSGGSQTIDDPMDVFLIAESIDFKDLTLDLQDANGRALSISADHVLFENQGDFHRLSAQVSVQGREALTLIMEAQGDPRDTGQRTMKAYLELKQLPLRRLRKVFQFDQLSFHSLPQNEDGLSVKVWADSPRGGDFTFQGNVSLETDALYWQDKWAFPNRVQTDFYGGYRKPSLPLLGNSLKGDSGAAVWFGLQGLGVQWPDAALENVNIQARRSNDKIWSVNVASVDLELLHKLTRTIGMTEGRLAETLSQLAPRGTLHHVEATIPQSEPKKFVMRSELRQVGANAWRGAPAVNQLDGYLETQAMKGHVRINSHNGFDILFKGVYDNPMVFETAQGSVGWDLRPNDNTVYVHSGPLVIKESLSSEAQMFPEAQVSPEAQTSDKLAQKRKSPLITDSTPPIIGQFSLRLPWKAGTAASDFNLIVGLENRPAQDYKKYTPSIVHPQLTQWLSDAIGEGEVDAGGFIYRGRLAGGDSAERAIQLWLDAKNADLNYQAPWPALQNVSAEVVLDNGLVTAAVERGQVWDTQLNAGSVLVDTTSAAGPVLTVEAGISGPAKDGIRFLNESPIQAFLGETFQQWSMTGKVAGDLSLTVPLQKDAAEHAQRVSLSFEESTLRMGDLNLQFESLEGGLIYDNKSGVTSDGIRGELWGRPVNATIMSPLNQPTKNTARDTVVHFAGDVAMTDLMSWTRRPELAFADGTGNVQGTLTIPADKTNALAQLNIQSTLEGVEIALPEPLGKPKATPADFALQIPIKKEGMSYDFQMNNAIHARLDINRGQLTQGAIGLHSPPIMADGVFNIGGQLSQFVLTDWVDFIQQYISVSTLYSEPGNQSQNLETHITMELDTAYLGNLAVDNVVVTGAQETEAWTFDIASDIASGRVAIPISGAPLQLSFDRLHLPGENEDTASVEIIATEDIPPAQPSEAINPAVDQVLLTDTLLAGALADTNVESQFDSAPSPSLQSQPLKDPLSDVDVTVLPAMDVLVASFKVGEEDYGQWAFEMRPMQQGVRIQSLNALIRGMVIGEQPSKKNASNANAKTAGAVIEWLKTDSGYQTHFTGRLTANNLKEVLIAWDKPPMLETQKATFNANLVWAGSPAAIDTNKLIGDLSVDIRRGRFINSTNAASDGVLRLIGLFNFDSWARRLRLDFSDLYQEGMAFDKIDGDLEFAEGDLLIIRPVTAKTPSSKLKIAGSIDLINEQMDTTLVATLPVGGNLTLLTAMAAGLPAAAGVYLVSKIFQKQVDKVASVSYRMKGGWNDPDMKFERLFDNSAAKKAGHGAAEKVVKSQPAQSPSEEASPSSPMASSP
ncbi:YhdP family protein [Marinibactrum halimedae]|uniref:YhdP central domain-containing protein n=1 Tax=Marinibactrum halimedae TaxID=1444977 RepID=A0AA37WNG1_9GAMM|nr:DUF3971 domain-containing protein [Marinibactrum halimedae]MCD9458079.1 hypothetical protein [Marinibactrum halimedae]GLS25012.1 hypothetical protein GCM10007877_07260 [Marinibactrum halimedae]